MSIEDAKRVAGEKAANLIQDGMVVGLGTGSTAFYFIQALIDKTKKGLKIEAVASSKRSFEMAKQGGLKIYDLDQVLRIDLTVDGADEIDRQKRMIKGGGGAHVREKILASASAKMVVIVDETKLVEHLGTGKLPIEIVPYGAEWTRRKICNLGFQGVWRKTQDGEHWRSDNGNFIFDLAFPHPLSNPEKVHEDILHIPGVIDTGFFFNLASDVIIGKTDGTTFNI